MKTFIIEEKFIGYADITIEAETEEESTARTESKSNCFLWCGECRIHDNLRGSE